MTHFGKLEESLAVFVLDEIVRDKDKHNLTVLHRHGNLFDPQLTQVVRKPAKTMKKLDIQALTL